VGQQQTAATKSKTTKVESSDPAVRGLQQHIVEQQALLDRGTANKTLTTEQVEAINADIAATEQKIMVLTSGSKEAPARFNSKGQQVITRDQFMNYPAEKQKEIAGSMKFEITDLLNGTPATLTARLSSVIYLTADQFQSTPPEKNFRSFRILGLM
jgi:hypothetical protein